MVHRNNNSNHYALIGGRVGIGENSADTIKRKIKEELGKNIEITGYISSIENFFEMQGSKYHEKKYMNTAYEMQIILTSPNILLLAMRETMKKGIQDSIEILSKKTQ